MSFILYLKKEETEANIDISYKNDFAYVTFSSIFSYAKIS